MAEITERLGNLNPFSKNRRIDDEDIGGRVDKATVAGGGHSARLPAMDLRVSHALRAYMVDQGILSPEDAGLDGDTPTQALHDLVTKPHVQVPRELVDRSYPLPEYFISSSHNTYLMDHQLYGQSNAMAYDLAMDMGARCVEIDAWDNSDDKSEPKVTHGYTLVSHITFRSVCETIRDVIDREAALAAATDSFRPTPILLSLENHCGDEGQLRLVEIMNEVWGDRLLSKPVREHGHREQAGNEEQHVTLEELGSKIAVIVEFHIQGEVSSDPNDSHSSESENEEEKRARREYNEQKKEACTIIIPELADLGVYAQSVKPGNDSWYTGQLIDGPHNHLINVSEIGIGELLPKHSQAISQHNAHHLMRVFPKGTRIDSSNLKPVAFWGIGAQICALNMQTFGTSNQLNEALFAGTDGYVLKPAALRAGGSGILTTGRKKKLRLHVAGATAIPLHEDAEADAIRPYLTCTLYHPDNLKDEPPKRKTLPYKHHKLGFLHRGENPPPTDPIWNETLEWDYDDNELVFVRMLIKSDESWSKNPMFAAAAVRLLYVVPGWSFVRMLDMQGHETRCSVLVRFEIEDA